MIQSVLFNKHLWTIEQARKYLQKHHLKDMGVDETENFYRYRQMTPPKDTKYYTKVLKGGVEMIIHY